MSENCKTARLTAERALRAALLFGAATFCGATIRPTAASQTEPSRPLSDRVLCTQVPVAAGAPGVALPVGSRIVALDPADPARGTVNLTADFAVAGRPSVSFDGRRVLFVARRRAADPLSVWEMSVDGAAPRQVVKRAVDCTRAIYLSRTYTINAAEPVLQIAFCTAPATTPSAASPAAIYTCRLDGSGVRRITFNPHGASDPCLLSDGRLVYSSGAPPALGGSVLFTVNTDGTDVFPFAAVHEPAAMRTMPCETLDGQVVYVETASKSSSAGGALVAVARTRSLRTRRVIAPELLRRYHSPSALPDGNLLVSARTDRGATYGIYVLDLQRGDLITKVFDDPRWHDLDAVAVRPRPVPAGRSSVVDERVDFGFLYCLDAALSDTARGGRISTLRVLQSGAAATGERVLGEVQVESDGSFYLQLPARTPLRLETLDETGQILQAMRNWIWVMPRERRGCIGCHEDRELTPPNRHVLALRKQARKIGIKTDRDGLANDAKGPK